MSSDLKRSPSPTFSPLDVSISRLLFDGRSGACFASLRLLSGCSVVTMSRLEPALRSSALAPPG
eukprot:11207368-Lingulodinium_polyedra.AAC.1